MRQQPRHRIPLDVARQVRLAEECRVNVVAEGGRLFVDPVGVPDLDALLARVEPGGRPEVADWGRPVGNEVW